MDQVLKYERWHVVNNDITGGWAICNVQAQLLSVVWGYKNVTVLLETPHEHIAQYVVSLHNARVTD